jgi:integrase
VESLTPREKSYLTHDATTRGLCVKVRPTGRKTFLVYRSVEGKPVKVTIGAFPAWTVLAARTKATQIIADLAQGKHKSRKAVVTLEELVTRYTKHLTAQGRRHPEYVGQVYRRCWSAWGARRLDTITSVEIAERHDELVSGGRVAAARAVKLLRTLFAYAVDMELMERNPAKRVRVQDSRPREVWLTAEELRVFHRALATMPQDARDYFTLLLLTGQRRSNVAGMRWADVDLDGGLWTIPAADFKTGRAVTVPLIGAAVDVLRSRSSAGVWVFPSAKSRSGHLMEPWFWLSELREKMAELGCSKVFTIHDLRRTHASILTSVGTPLTIVAKSLGHANVGSTPIYARAGVAEVRAAVESAVGVLAGS